MKYLPVYLAAAFAGVCLGAATQLGGASILRSLLAASAALTTILTIALANDTMRSNP